MEKYDDGERLLLTLAQVSKLVGGNPKRFLSSNNIQAVEDYGVGRGCGKRYRRDQIVSAIINKMNVNQTIELLIRRKKRINKSCRNDDVKFFKID